MSLGERRKKVSTTPRTIGPGPNPYILPAPVPASHPRTMAAGVRVSSPLGELPRQPLFSGLHLPPLCPLAYTAPSRVQPQRHLSDDPRQSSAPRYRVAAYPERTDPPAMSYSAMTARSPTRSLPSVSPMSLSSDIDIRTSPRRGRLIAGQRRDYATYELDDARYFFPWCVIAPRSLL